MDWLYVIGISGILVQWTLGSFPRTMTTYYEMQQYLTWNEARNSCLTLSPNARLLTIKSESDFHAISHLISNKFGSDYLKYGDAEVWIGLHDPDIDTPGGYVWADDPDPFTTWTRWRADEPSHQTSQFCIAVSNASTHSKWFTADCREKRSFICEDNDGGDCEFNAVSSISGLNGSNVCSRNSIFKFTNATSLGECQDHCRNTTHADKECLCIGFRPDLLRCALKGAVNPAYFLPPDVDPTRFQISGVATGFYRRCDKAEHVEPQNVTFSHDNSSIPKTTFNITVTRDVTPLRMTEYTIVNVEATWNEARCFCESLNETLMTMESFLDTYEASYVSDLEFGSGAQRVWIDLHDASLIGHFSWSGSENDFHFWDNLQPRPISEEKYCASAGEANMYWKSEPCNKSLPFVCKRTNYAPCEFEFMGGICLDNTVNALTVIGVDHAMCEEFCLTATTLDGECMGYQVHLGGNISCHVFFASWPYHYVDPDRFTTCLGLSAGVTELYLKRCLSVLEIINATIIRGSSELTPNSSCPTPPPTTDAATTIQEATSIGTTTIPIATDIGATTIAESTSIGETTNNPSTQEGTETTETRTTAFMTTPITTRASTVTRELRVNLYKPRCACLTCASNVTVSASIENIMASMKTDKKGTAKSKMRYSSAEDSRTSAKSIGCFAVIIASCPFVLIVLSDAMYLFKAMQPKIHDSSKETGNKAASAKKVKQCLGPNK